MHPDGMLTEDFAHVGRTLLSAAFDFGCGAAPSPAKVLTWVAHLFSAAISLQDAFTGWLKAIP